MKFLLRYSDLLEKQNDTKFIRTLTKFISETNKIYILIDDKDFSSVTNIDSTKKIVDLYEKLLRKMGIPFHNILLDKNENILNVMNRNHFDVIVSSRLEDMFAIENDKYIKFLNINNAYLDFHLKRLIKDANKPLLDSSFVRTDKPSEDKIWLKHYTQKELSDLERLSLDKSSNWAHICNQTTDFDYLPAIDYYGTIITYHDLKQKVREFSQSFANIGIKKGDTVTICTPNVPSGIYAWYALQNIGAIPSMLHVYSSSADMNHYFNKENSKAVVMIGMKETCDNIQQAIEGTNVKKVISVPLTDSIGTKTFESLKTRFGITLLTSKFGKSLQNVSKSLKKYKLDKKFNPKTTIGLFECIREAIKNAPVFELPKDERFITLAEFLENGKNTPYEPAENDICTIIHTGGTTGRGKSTLITQNNITSNDDAFEATIPDFEKGDSIIAIPPLFHVLGLNNCINLILRNGGKIVLISKYNKKEMPKLFMKHKPELLFGVPKIGRDIIKNPKFEGVDLSSLKYYVLGGEEMSKEFVDDSSDFLKRNGAKIDISQSLGATEGTCCFTNTFAKANVHGSIGIPLINVDAKIVKKLADGSYIEANYNEVGEMCFSADSIMKGYLNDEEATKEALKIHEDGKLWLHTGDCGYINEDGVLFFVDRIKEMVKINGEQVYPSEIKKVICSHPLVDSCAVVCVENAEHQKTLIATVTLKDETLDQTIIKNEIKALCENNLQKESRPRMIEIRSNLPETNLYKLDNQALKKEYEAQILSLHKKSIS